MIQQFTFTAPTRVTFGSGSRHDLRAQLAAGRWGVLSSPTVRTKSGIAEVFGDGRVGDIEFVSIGNVSPNPRLSEVQTGLELARAAELVGVLGVGGGSVIDAAKLLRVAFAREASAREALDNLAEVVARPLVRNCPLVVIPTTSGTGAEVSRGSIITDDTTGEKRAARGEALVPDVAIVDPQLTMSLPARRTAETGFDVIAHAVETFLSQIANPVTDLIARSAMAVVPAALIAAVDDGTNLPAREVLSLHSWLMGYNLAHASTCLPHRLQYPIGSATDTSHQIGLAAIYPAWLRRVEVVAASRTQEVGDAISHGIGAGATRPAHQTMIDFLERIGIRVNLRDLGLALDDTEGLADAVTGRTDLDPLQPDRAMIADIYRESMDA